ncbi:hypothetical protein E5288_WYG003612 [Bos mutus]|uniref:Uncharacterized protein n=1 Tax=Bos mutus TaxID=72004 RepID=A0A6B0RT80_9CETA|nr:hypothetical protein [Bos mutus]
MAWTQPEPCLLKTTHPQCGHLNFTADRALILQSRNPQARKPGCWEKSSVSLSPVMQAGSPCSLRSLTDCDRE